jgi:hypothetical protein
MTATDSIRTVAPEVAIAHLKIIRYGLITMEESMRLLFPEEAAQIYAPDRWPWGPPKGE